MKSILKKIWRVFRSRRDQLLEEAKEAARLEAKQVVIELMKELVQELNASATQPALPADRARPSNARSTSDEPKLGATKEELNGR